MSHKPQHSVPDPYADYVEHPRFGRGPRITGLNPDPMDLNIDFHSNAYGTLELAARAEKIGVPVFLRKLPPYLIHESCRIPGTAVPADPSRQCPATVAITHYFDLRRICLDCRRPFIFFAQEQKYWYEELKFPLEADCVRCHECRKKQRDLVQQCEDYRALFHQPDKTPEQLLAMATLGLSLIDARIFTPKRAQFLRQLLNSIPKDHPLRNTPEFQEVDQRSLALVRTQNDDGGLPV